jgi:hypothetical protein
MAVADPPVSTATPGSKDHEPSRWWRRHSGALVGIAVTVAGFLADQFGPSFVEREAVVVISLLFVFIGLHFDQRTQTVDLLHQITHAFKPQLETLHGRIDILQSRISELSKALKLLDIMENLKADEPLVKALLENARRVEEVCKRGTLLKQKALILDQATKRLQEVCGDKFATLFWDCHVLENAVLDMEEKGPGLLGVSPWSSTDRSWWDTDHGKSFMKANLLACQNRRRIRRVFVYDSAQVDQKLGDTVRAHAAAKFEVRVLRVADWPASIRGIEAMAVVDGWLAFRGDTHRWTKCHMNYFYTSTNRVKEITDDLELIWEIAGRDPSHLETVLNGSRS